MAFKLKPEKEKPVKHLWRTWSLLECVPLLCQTQTLVSWKHATCSIFSLSVRQKRHWFTFKNPASMLHAQLLRIVIDNGNMDCWLVKGIVENLDLATNMVWEVYVKIGQIVLFILRPVGGTDKRANVVAGNNRSEMLKVNWRLYDLFVKKVWVFL